MVDPARLADLLDDYRTALLTHRERVEEGFTRTRDAYRRIEGYDWQAAQEFRSRFERSAAAFDAYVTGTRGLLSLLEERIDALRELARTQL